MKRSTGEHSFGGSWTEIKLLRVAKYLSAYTKIFNANENAQYLTTTYVDAFAGTGSYKPKTEVRSSPDTLLWPEMAAPEVEEFRKGSARIALDIEPSFDHYIFIEQEPEYAAELHRLRNLNYEQRHKIEIAQAESNSYLLSWCKQQNWKKERAVVFLDPYALQVDWATLEALGKTQGVDLWLLWPIGQVINRLLTKKQLPPPAWGDALTRAFGADTWQARFYAPEQSEQQVLVGMEGSEAEAIVKTANFAEIESFFIERLNTIFDFVAPNPLYLYNSTKAPLYLLCFASHNENAMKIAKDILQK